MNATAGITDEWIFQIVPKEVFDMQPNDFLYIGKKYGFYVDYDNNNNTYIVYLMLHTYDITTTSGHIVRKIEPLYYERYKYDNTTGTAALRYMNIGGSGMCYVKCSTFEKYILRT